MSEQKNMSIEDIQRLNGLLEDTLSSQSKEQIIQLLRLVSSSLGSIRAQQSQEDKLAEAQHRVALAQNMQAGDEAATQEVHKATVAGITEILSALNVMQEQNK